MQAGSYSVTENLTAAQVTAGWTLKSLVCSGGTTSTSGSTANITLAAGEAIDCTYTNHINAKPDDRDDAVGQPGQHRIQRPRLGGADRRHQQRRRNRHLHRLHRHACRRARGRRHEDRHQRRRARLRPITFNSAGDYYWQAVYSGDANNNGATSACTSEHLVVDKASPTIATTLSAQPGQHRIHRPRLVGAHRRHQQRGRNRHLHRLHQLACTLGAQSAGTKTVTNGSVPDSDPITFNSAGDFYWQAVYSGDANNNAATSACTSEHLVVNKLQPNVSTAQHLIPNDDFTLSAATSNVGGTITFNLYAPADTTCAGAPALTQTVTVNGNATYSTTNTSFVASTEGTWRWQSSYSGDSNNQSATSNCGTERFTIANS